MDKIEFYFQGNPIGFILEDAPPFQKGTIRYEPFHGPGHDGMRLEIKSKGSARCYYDSEQGRQLFDVISCPGYGMLELENFSLSTLARKPLIEWLEPWISATPGAEKELEKEVGPHHPLYQKKCVPVARRIDKDEILFEIEPLKSYAVVHLTWSGKPGSDARFPMTEVFQTLEDWVENRMKKDHKEYMA